MNVRCGMIGKGSLTVSAVVLAFLCAFPAAANSQDKSKSPEAPKSAEATKPPDAKDAPSKAALQKLYMSYLADEGFKPDIDSDGDVRYKSEGKTYWIIIDPGDSQYFRLAMLNIWKIESEAERRKVLAAVDYANARTKVCKAYTIGDNVWVCIELFVAKPEDFKPLFSRATSAMALGYSNFLQKMRE
jgi:hypothetical protein